MECSQVKKRLSAFLDNELTAEESSQISEHLKSCIHCAKEFETLSQVSDFLNVMGEIEVSPYFNVRLKQRIRDESLKGFIRLPLFESIKRIAVPVGIAALFIISILGGNRLGSLFYQREIDNLTELNEELADLSGTTTFDDFSEGSLGEVLDGLVTEGGE
ncbi:MAG: anti-sigma factor family protein [Candidatus Hermodarchaeota archaeon]